MQSNITEKDYNQFMEDTWQIVETNEDFKSLFTRVQNMNKFRQAKFMTDLFIYWKQNKVEWFLNNEVLKHADK